MLAIGNSPWPNSADASARQGASTQPSQLMVADGKPPWPSSSKAPDLPGPARQGSTAPAAGGSFIPTYEWAAVPEGASVPPGLEVRLTMDGSGRKMARVPATWRMLVVAEPSNDACRLDVTRHTQLGEVRAKIAGSLVGGDNSRVTALLAGGVMVAMEGTAHGCWMRTVEQAQLFGQRMTCILAPEEAATGGEPVDVQGPGEFDELLALLEQLEGSVAEVERALELSRVTVSRAHSELAQLEAQLDRLQCRGIDNAPASTDAARQQRKELTRRTEVLSARLSGLFVGLGAAKRQGGTASSRRR